MKNLIIFCLLLLSYSLGAFARQPAVLPGKTISTAQYNNLPQNSKFKGYKFNQTPTKNQNVINQNLNKLSAAGPQSISIYLTIFALLFPFGLWLLNNKSLKDENDIINRSIDDTITPDEGGLDNVIELGYNSSEDELSDSDDDQQKKAS